MFELVKVGYNNKKKDEVIAECRIPIKVKNLDSDKDKFIITDYYKDKFILKMLDDHNNDFITNFQQFQIELKSSVILKKIRKMFKLSDDCVVNITTNQYENADENAALILYDSINITGEGLIQKMRKLKIENLLK